VALAVWAGLCLIAVIVLRVYGTADPQKRKPTDWVHVGISGVAFVLWIYSMPGGPFDVNGLYQGWLASLLILAWTFFVPIFYKGPEN